MKARYSVEMSIKEFHPNLEELKQKAQKHLDRKKTREKGILY